MPQTDWLDASGPSMTSIAVLIWQSAGATFSEQIRMTILNISGVNLFFRFVIATATLLLQCTKHISKARAIACQKF
jgi:hypothetical protein